MGYGSTDTWPGVINSLIEKCAVVLLTLIICGAIITGIFILCTLANSNSSDIEESRLAKQLKIIITEYKGNRTIDMTHEERVEIATMLLKTYDPATDSLKVTYDPSEIRQPNGINKILDLIDTKFGNKSKSITDKLRDFDKSKGKSGW